MPKQRNTDSDSLPPAKARDPSSNSCPERRFVTAAPLRDLRVRHRLHDCRSGRPVRGTVQEKGVVDSM